MKGRTMSKEFNFPPDARARVNMLTNQTNAAESTWEKKGTRLSQSGSMAERAINGKKGHGHAAEGSVEQVPEEED